MKLVTYNWQSTTGLLKPGDVTLVAAPSREHAAHEPMPLPRGEFFVTFRRSVRARIAVPAGASGASWEFLEPFAWDGVDKAES